MVDRIFDPDEEGQMLEDLHKKYDEEIYSRVPATARNNSQTSSSKPVAKTQPKPKVKVVVRTQEKPKVVPKRTKEGEAVAHVQVKSTVQKKDLNLAQSAALIALKEGKAMQVIDDGKKAIKGYDDAKQAYKQGDADAYYKATEEVAGGAGTINDAVKDGADRFKLDQTAKGLNVVGYGLKTAEGYSAYQQGGYHKGKFAAKEVVSAATGRVVDGIAAGASTFFSPLAGGAIKGTAWYFDVEGKVGDMGGKTYFHHYAAKEVGKEENDELLQEAKSRGFKTIESYLLWKHRKGTFVIPAHKRLHYWDYLFGPYDPEIDGPVEERANKIEQKKNELDPDWNKEKEDE